MSSVDERIVEMQFDNAQFENGARQTISTLSQLKDSLKLEDSAKSFSNISKAASNVDFEGLNKAIDKVNYRFSTMGVIATTVLQNITNSCVNIVKNGIGSIFGQIKQGGWKRALNVEQARFQLSGLMSDEEKAAGKVEAIVNAAKESVQDTAYGADEASRLASTLYASGITDAEKMKEVLTGVAGAAAMSGREYADVGQIIATVASNGKLMTEQLRQFAFSGLNISAFLAKDLGKSEQEVNDMVSKGEISFDQFMDTIVTHFGEHAKEANNTFNGSLANMRAALSRIGQDIAQHILPAGTKVFNGLKNIINDIHKIIQPVLDHIGVRIDQIGDATSNWLANVDKWLQKFIPNTDKAKESVGGLVDKLTGSGDEVGKSGEEVRKTVDGLIASGSDFDEIVRQVIVGGHFSKNLDEEKEQLEALGYSFDAVQNKVNEYFGVSKRRNVEYAEEVDNVVTETKKAVSASTIFSSIGTIISNTFHNVVSVVKAVGVAFKEVFAGKLINGISAAFKGIADITTKLRINEHGMSVIKNIFTGLFSAVMLVCRGIGFLLKLLSPLGGLLVKIGDWLASLLGEIGKFIGNVSSAAEKTNFWANALTAVREMFEKIGKVIKDVAKKIISLIPKQVIDRITSFGKAIADLFIGIRDLSGEKILSAFNTMKSVIKSGIDNLVTNVWPWIKESVASLFTKIGGFFSDVLGGKIKISNLDVKSIGQAIADFFKPVTEFVAKHIPFDKIKNAIQNVFKQISGSNFIETIKKAALVVKDFAENAIGKLAEKYPALGKIFDKIKEFIDLVKPGVIDIIRRFASAIKELLTNLWTGISTGDFGKFNETVISGIGTAIKFVYDKLMILAPVFNTIKKAIIGFVTDHKDEIFGFFSKLGEGVKSAVEVIVDAITTANWKEIWDGICKFFEDAYKRISKVIAGFKEAFQSLFGGVTVYADDGSQPTSENASAKGGPLEFINSFIENIISLKGPMKTAMKVVVGFLALRTWIAKIRFSNSISEFLQFWSKKGALHRLIKEPDTMSTFQKVLAFIKQITVTFVSLAAAMAVLSYVQKKNGNLEEVAGTFAKTLGAIFGILLAYQGVAKVLKFDSLMGVGVALIGLSISLFAIVGVIKMLNGVDIGDYTNGIMIVIGEVIAICLAMKGLSKATEGGSGAGAFKNILAMCVALIVITHSIKSISKLDAGKAAASAAVVAGELIAMAVALRIAGKSAQGVKAGPFLAMAVTIGILTICIKTISDMDPNRATDSVVALIALMAMMRVMVKSMTKATVGTIGNILALSAFILSLTACLSMLVTLQKSGELMDAVGAISAIIGAFTLLETVGRFGGAGAAIKIGMMAVLLGALAGVVFILKKFVGVKNAVAIIGAISAMLLAMSKMTAFCIALYPMALLGPKLALGILAVAGVIAAIIAVAVLLRKIPGVLDAIKGVAGDFGEVIGHFLAGIVVGAFEKLKATKFDPKDAEMASQIIKAMASIDGDLPKANFLEAITVGNTNWIAFAKSIAAMADGLKTMHDKFKDIKDWDSMKDAAAQATTVITTWASIDGQLPKANFLEGIIGINFDWNAFAGSIGTMSGALRTMAINLLPIGLLWKVLPSISKKAAAVVGTWAGIDGDIPNANFFESIIGIDLDWNAFANSMVKMSSGLVVMSNNFNQIGNMDDFENAGTKAANVVGAWAAVGKIVPPTTAGLAKLFKATTEQTWTDFADGITYMSDALVTIHENLSGTNLFALGYETMMATAVVSAWGSIDKKVPPTVGRLQKLFSGGGTDDRWSDFGSGISSMAEALKNTSSTLMSMGLSLFALPLITNIAVAVVKTWADIDERIPEPTTDKLGILVSVKDKWKDFADAIIAMVDGLVSLRDKMAELGIGGLLSLAATTGTVVGILKKFATLDSVIPKVSGFLTNLFDGSRDRWENFSTGIGFLGSGLAAFKTNLPTTFVWTDFDRAIGAMAKLAKIGQIDTDFAAAATGDFGQAAANIGAGVNRFVEGLGGVSTKGLSITSAAAKRVAEAIAEIAAIDPSAANQNAKKLRDSFVTIGEELGEMASSFQSAGGKFTSIKPMINGIKSTIEMLGALNTTTLPAPTKLKDTLSALTEGGLDDFVAKMSTYQSKLKNSGKDLINAFIDSISKAASSANLAPLKKLGEDINKAIADVISGAKSSSSSSNGSSIGNSIVQSILGGVTGSTDKFFGAGVKMSSRLLSGITSYKTTIGGAGGILANAAINGAEKKAASMRSAGGMIGAAFYVGVGKWTSLSRGAGSNLASAAVSGASGKDGAMRSAGGMIGAAFYVGVGKWISTLRTTGNNLASSAVAGASGHEHAAAMRSVGSNLGAGLYAGMIRWAHTIAAAASNMVSNAVRSARISGEVRSPSRKMIKVGMYLALGLAVGMTRHAGEVAEAARNTVTDAINSVSKMLSNSPSLLDGLSDVNPVITPVVDLSNVRRGANSINGLLNDTYGLNTALGASSYLANQNRMSVADRLTEAIGGLRDDLRNMEHNVYNVGGVTYDDGSNVSNAVRDLIHATKIAGRT